MPMQLRRRTLPIGFWKGSTTKKRSVRRAVSRMKPATKTAIRAIAKQVIRKEAEDKFVGGIVENSYTHNGQISNADIYPLLPPVAQGTGYNERIGHKIRPKYLSIEYVSHSMRVPTLRPLTISICGVSPASVSNHTTSPVALEVELSI